MFKEKSFFFLIDDSNSLGLVMVSLDADDWQATLRL